ncbi:MAG: hypothetical protein HY926_08775 [Elusimicrobia bacterium]|nr:hypothetical protein [Elusimicrobiota bacterium]
MDRHPSTDGLRQDLILGALMLAGVLLAMLPQVHPDAAAHPDLVRDLLLARNCQGGRCVSQGSPSSMAFFHGFAFNRFLDLLPRLGIPLSALPLTLLVLHAAGLSLFFHVLSRETDRWTGLLGTLAYAGLTWSRIIESPQIFSLLPFLLNLLIFLLHKTCRASPRGRALGAVACALLWGLATQVHLEMLLFLPGAAAALLSLPRTRRVLPEVVLVLAASWMLLSWDSLAANLRILGSAAWTPSLARPGQAWVSAGAWGGWLLAAALGYRSLSRRSEGRLPLFNRIMLAGAVGYALSLTCILTSHFLDAQYLETLIPPAIWLAARWGRAWIQRAAASTLLRWTIPLALLGLIRWQHPPAATPGLSGPLTLGEVRLLTRALHREGRPFDEIYARVSSGQGIQSDLQSGLWLEAPCLSGARRLGELAPGAPRVLLTAVPSGFRPEPWEGVRVASRGRDFLLTEYPPWLDPTRFAPAGESPDAGGRRTWRTLAFDNPDFGRDTCMDGNLPYAARAAVSPREASALVFPVRVPAWGEPRVIYLPAASGPGRGLAACAGRFTAVRGLKGRLSDDGRRLELRPAGAAQEGTVTIAWPVSDPRCGLDLRFYPVPVAEMPAKLFARLGPFLD